MSGGKSTIMMVCENEQMLANHTIGVAPRNFNATKLENPAMMKVLPYSYRTDERMFLQRNSTGKNQGNLLKFDAQKRSWDFLFVFSTYYNIDWAAINVKEKWIGYRVDGFNVLWWFNYQ